MIKYIGSKRRLVPVLRAMAAASGARTGLDLFTGTTRVAQAFKGEGVHVTAADSARYADVFARCYIATDADAVDRQALERILADLAARPGYDGYFTQTFCVDARFFQPHNGRRVDAIRDAIEREHRDSPLYAVLLTSLVEAADRVDSTTGVQMAYVKEWAPRSYGDLELRVPELLPGTGRAVHGDAVALAARLGGFDLAYLDPPYNQHRYFTNYHIWETLVAWDAPEYYGVACKRVDAREVQTKSVFNQRRGMRDALARVIDDLDAGLLVVSYNNESWVSIDDLEAMCEPRGTVRTLAFDSRRYVGAQIGIHNPSGEKVGTVSHLRNLEYLVLAGAASVVDRVARAAPTSLARS